MFQIINFFYNKIKTMRQFLMMIPFIKDKDETYSISAI